MSLDRGAKLGPYEILGPLGAGAMGTVYKARDTRLDRIVAIKVLKSQVDPRFLQEARAIAALNHPHVCSLYDVGPDYLVMEYIEGKPLRGPLPVREAMERALQVASALEAAHLKGIVHGDLKPDNILLTRSGVKLLDFGLARVPRRPMSGLSETQTLDYEQQGTIVGTPQYMAPEQLAGQEASQRSDIWAFGCVLYELIIGYPAFRGEALSQLIAAVLKDEPVSIGGIEPSAVQILIRNCLAKDPNERWLSMHDVRLALMCASQVQVARAPDGQETKTSPRNVWLVGGAVAFLAIIAVLGWSGWHQRPRSPSTIQFAAFPPDNVALGEALAISPDGTRLVFPASASDGRTMLWIRSLASSVAHAVPGTDDGAYPFWSPDSSSIAYFARGKLKKTNFVDGETRILCSTGMGGGGTWNRRGIIVFGGSLNDVLYRVPDSGGEPMAITRLDAEREELSHTHPVFMPDGRHYFYLLRSRKRETTGVFVGTLGDDPDAKKRHKLIDTFAMAGFAAPNHLLYLSGSRLMAVRVNTSTMQLVGDPFPVTEQVEYFDRSGMAPFSASENGVLAFRAGSVTYTQPTWFDRIGKVIGNVGPAAEYRHISLSPDDRFLTFDRLDAQSGSRDIWMMDLARGVVSRMTSNPYTNRRAIWAPDGGRIVFTTSREGRQDWFQKPVGGGPEDRLLETSEERELMDWSPDGEHILYSTYSRKTSTDLWALPLNGNKEAFAVLQSEYWEYQGRFQPGRNRGQQWIAYVSDETGRREIYVATFPQLSRKYRISRNGGADPQWSRDGKELFYISLDRKLMSVRLQLEGGFYSSVPSSLFAVSVFNLGYTRTVYAPASDGKRFLVNSLVTEQVSSPISVLVNWTAGLKR